MKISKGIVSAALAALLLMVGCTKEQRPDARPTGPSAVNQSGGEQAGDQEGLARLLAAVASAKLEHARISAVEASNGESYTVRVTGQLLRDIGEVVLEGEPQSIGSSAKRISGDLDSRYIMISFFYGGNDEGDDEQYASIELWSGTNEYPAHTLLWMQLDEDVYGYLLQPEVMGKVQALIDAQTVPSQLLLEGKYVRAVPDALAAGGKLFEGLDLEDALEVDGRLLLFWRTDTGYQLDCIDPATGETQVLWEHTESQMISGERFRLEQAEYGALDYRITGFGMVVYGDSAGQNELQTFAAPAEISDSPRLSYDIHPQTGVMAYSADDGVYVGTQGAIVKVLDHESAPPSPAQERELEDDRFDAFYGRVHLLDSGRRLAVQVLHPGSQSGVHSVAVVDIATGQVTLFSDLFSAMVAHASYPDEKTIAAFSMEQITLIDAQTMQVTKQPYYFGALTHNYETYLELSMENDAQGVPTGEVEIFSIDTPEQRRSLLEVTGERAQLTAVTEHYGLLLCKDGRDCFVAILSLDD